MIWVDLGERISKLARNSVPALLTLLLLFLTVMPWRPIAAPLAGSLVLVSIYFWSLHEPQAMPAWLCGAIGLIGDLLGVAPLGVGTMSALLVHGMANIRRRDVSRSGQLTVWGLFALVSLVVALVAWILASIANGGWVDMESAGHQFMLNIAAYPILAYLFGRTNRLLKRS